MSPELLLALAGFAFVSSITPGPNNLMLLASGVNFGLWRTVPHMLGISLGHAFMVLMVGVGLIQLFDAWPMSYTILKVVSVAYLLYLAWKIATASSMGEATSTGKPMTFFQAAAFQWVNPKAWTMALTALTAYTAAGSGYVGILTTALVFSMINFPSVTIWTVLGQEMRRFLGTERRVRIFNITAAILLVASLYPILFPGA